MKKTNTSLAIAVALAAGVGTSVFAQNIKEDTITFALTAQKQVSVSTSATAANAGTWEEVPFYYKTGTAKVTQANIIQFIGAVLWDNPSHYSSSAVLVLDQSELSGFFGITPDLASEEPNVWSSGTSELNGTFDDNGDFLTDLNDSSYSSFVAFANGRHDTNNPNIGTLPVGHVQPWGQIWVKDKVKGQYDNVTFFFALSVEECYDCFYMNSFISQATFKNKVGAQNGPPCCSISSVVIGSGKDSYYLSLSFDNTENNPYLYYYSSCYVGWQVGTATISGGADVEGYGFPTSTAAIPGDAIVPDALPYDSTILSHLGKNLPYEARFTLNGIMTYTWTLNYINGGADIQPDFVGTGVYDVNGYGFIALYCSLLTGTVDFTEKVVKESTTIDDLYLSANGDYWSEDWYGVGAEYVQGFDDSSNSYYWETAYDYGDYLVPINVGTSLTYHENFNVIYPANSDKSEGTGTGPGGLPYNFAPASWPHSGYVPSLYFNDDLPE